MGGGGSTYDYGFRIYNPALGKFLSVDPLTKSYPWYTPYQFAGNSPIWAIDIDGLEEYIVTVWYRSNGRYAGTTIRKIDREQVLKRLENQPYGRTGAYYISRQLPNNIEDINQLKVNQKNPANWDRVLRPEADIQSNNNGNRDSYYSETLDPFDKGLNNWQNRGNSISIIPAVLIGEPDILFDEGKADIKSEYKGVLDDYALFAANLEGLEINIEGFASEDGKASDNQSLSNARAMAVKNYLAAKIVELNPDANPDIIINAGSGAGETNKYGADETKNRRASISVTVPAKKFRKTAENEKASE